MRSISAAGWYLAGTGADPLLPSASPTSLPESRPSRGGSDSQHPLEVDRDRQLSAPFGCPPPKRSTLLDEHLVRHLAICVDRLDSAAERDGVLATRERP